MTQAENASEALDWGTLRPRLVRFLTRRTGCVATAEDVAQDLWLRIGPRRLERGDEILNPASYLFAAAANLARDDLRAQRRRDSLKAEAMSLVMDGLQDMTVNSPERCALASEELARTMAVIDALPARTREIFTLNRFEAIPYRQIASRLAISTTAVEKHMKRALDALALLRAEESGQRTASKK
ncbi:RNA polymerase sigma factor [Sphingomonas sp. OTU376]|uniref:RNA polymerase sigma factor n=1 Tax=Sphingomonas sp. OTU376 TaxID=3043863 RepID=UPI00313C3F39